MKQVLSFVLIDLVASMIVGLPTTFADSKLDSLANIAMKARAQVKFQVERSQNTSDELRALFEQGSQQTDLLISAVEQGNTADAKQYFVSAMKIFKQVTIELSEPQQTSTTLRTQVPPEVLISYRNSIDRTEKYAAMLKDLVARNNFTVNFSVVDKLVQDARLSLSTSDITSVERIFTEIEAALKDIQNAISEQTIQRQNERIRLFVNSYIARIEAKIAALEPNIDDTIAPKFEETKEMISQLKSQTSTGEAIQLMRQIDSQIKEIENYVGSKQTRTETQQTESTPTKPAEEQKSTTDSKQESKQEDVKTQSFAAEISKLEARLEAIKPYVDENINNNFQRAESLLNTLKNQELSSTADYQRTIRIVDFLIDGMERYLKSLQNEAEKSSENSRNTNPQLEKELKIKPSEKPKNN
jgi:hypothetical protein